MLVFKFIYTTCIHRERNSDSTDQPKSFMISGMFVFLASNKNSQLSTSFLLKSMKQRLLTSIKLSFSVTLTVFLFYRLTLSCYMLINIYSKYIYPCKH